MNTPSLPPNHKLLLPDFLRQHGAVKDMRYHNPEGPSNTEWSYWLDYKILPRALRKFTFCAPVGSIAAATTPVPEGRCCGECEESIGNSFKGHACKVVRHIQTCPAHPRNAYVHILPHQLAQLPEKPEGLIERFGNNCPQGQKDNWSPSPIQWPFTMEGDLDIVAYAVPRHVMDRIEQQLSTKSKYHQPKDWIEQFSGPEAEFTICHPSTPLKPTAVVRPASSADTEFIHGTAAPESSDPTGEAAPSDIQIKPQEDRVIVTLGNGNYMDLYHTGIGVLVIINGPDKGIYEFQMKEDRK